MRPVSPTAFFALLLTVACSPSDSGTTTGTTTDSTGHAHETHGTHETGSETAAPTEAHDTHEHETHATHAEETGTTGAATPVDVYCECMLENCHDQYHALWGEDHVESEAMCQAAAGAVPSVGMDAMSGDSIECRTHFCSVGHDDAAACESALGGAPCQ